MSVGFGIGSPTWGDFNSLIQLSIGLNAAFATFSDFLGNGLEKENHNINRLIKKARSQSTLSQQGAPGDALSDRTQLMFLAAECAANKIEHERIRSGVVRVSGFFCAFLGVAVLIYASYFANVETSLFGQFIIYILFFPFAIGAVHGMLTSLRIQWKISSKRQSIEGRIAKRGNISVKSEVNNVEKNAQKLDDSTNSGIIAGSPNPNQEAGKC